MLVHMRERLEARPALRLSPQRAEAREASAPKEMIAHCTPGRDLVYLALIEFGKQALEASLRR